MNMSALSVGCSWMPFSRNQPDNPTLIRDNPTKSYNSSLVSIAAIRKDPTLTRQPDIDPINVITFELQILSQQMNINLRDTGAEIGFACARVLALSSFSLISSLLVSGSIAVVGSFPLIEEPAHRVAKMSAILMGASAAGCILGAWMTGAIGKNDDEKLTFIVTNELAITKDELTELRSQLRESEMRRIDAIDARDVRFVSR